MKEIRNPQEMLAEARDRLAKCRQLFILSTLMLIASPPKRESQTFWINTWFNVSSEEERITRELVAPAKLKTGAFRTVPKVERRVKKEAANFIKGISDLDPKDAYRLAGTIVNPRIIFTKKIQEEMGVPDQIVYSEKPNSERFAIRRSTNLGKAVS